MPDTSLQLKAYQRDAEYEVSNLQKDFDLASFFEDVNIRKIAELETFHKEMKAILQKELKATIAEIWRNIHMLNDAIKSLRIAWLNYMELQKFQK